MNRRLAAIAVADVVGYSRLMEADEAGTLAALKERRKTILEPVVREHGGRIVKLMGDGVLIEFASAVKAVEAALDLQKRFMAANADVPEPRHITLRVGINLGDVVGEGADIYGDGVNIAARIQALAAPGGVSISAKVREEAEGKIKANFVDTGEHGLKNIERPVRIFRLDPISSTVAHTDGDLAHKHARPAIAVLPFLNMSGDPEQTYFSDGITEDIITELSRFRSLFVIARNSSFQYRGNSVDVRKVGRELGVHFVVEGSIRRAAERLRITAQLIDARTGEHVWAERYDRDMKDVFEAQDEMARTIAATLEGRVAASTAEKNKQRPTQDWRAYDYFLQGRERDEQYDPEGAEPYYARAAELDPNYAHAHAFRAIALAVSSFYAPNAWDWRLADDCVRKALAIDPHDAWCHQAAGYVALCQAKFSLAGMHLERALSLNPNSGLIVADHASWLVRTGRLQEALERLDAAVRRDPFAAQWIWEIRFRALFHLGRYEEAIAALDNMSKPPAYCHVYYAAAYAHFEREAEARAEIALLLKEIPYASVSMVARVEPYSKQQLCDHLLDGLRKAGLPE